jgi:hypothetical protein
MLRKTVLKKKHASVLSKIHLESQSNSISCSMEHQRFCSIKKELWLLGTECELNSRMLDTGTRAQSVCHPSCLLHQRSARARHCHLLADPISPLDQCSPVLDIVGISLHFVETTFTRAALCSGMHNKPITLVWFLCSGPQIINHSYFRIMNFDIICYLRIIIYYHRFSC